MTRTELAKDAFYGNNEALMSHILRANGYTMNGTFFPANSIDLSECIAFVAEMPREDLNLYIFKKQCSSCGTWYVEAYERCPRCQSDLFE